jgi:hypothetical protein
MPINYAQKAPVNGREAHDFSEDEAPEGFRYVPQLERRRAMVETSAGNRRIDRYDAWDRAREQFRANPMHVAETALPDPGTSAREVIEFDRPYRSVVGPPPIPVSSHGSLPSSIRFIQSRKKSADNSLSYCDALIIIGPDASSSTQSARGVSCRRWYVLPKNDDCPV